MASEIRTLRNHVGETVTVQGWLYRKRSSGKIHFLIVRDGTGVVQVVVPGHEVSAEAFQAAGQLTQESSVRVTGVVRADDRAPGGVELSMTDLEVLQIAQEYPITPKEHGVEFLMDHRHLWLRAPRQAAILRVRARIIRSLQEFLNERGFVRVDGPILTPNAVEGTSTLFETDYFGEKAYLTQSAQLYAEAAAMALGKIYTFGPTFRAEKSKTRRHLIEFWMLEPEMAFYTHDDNMRLQEELVSAVVADVVEQCSEELATLDRDLTPLLRVKPPFPRITYDEALQLLEEKGLSLPWGEDFGAPHETAIAESFDRPVFVEKFPAQIKAFYMQPDAVRPEVVLGADLLAPEGYGEVIGGSERVHDLALLRQRLEEHRLPEEVFSWYLDLRRYGSVPHSGFGMGLERMVAWICKLEHVRETIPFPRLLNRLTP